MDYTCLVAGPLSQSQKVLKRHLQEAPIIMIRAGLQHNMKASLSILILPERHTSTFTEGNKVAGAYHR